MNCLSVLIAAGIIGVDSSPLVERGDESFPGCLLGSVTTVSKEVLQVVTDNDGDITRSHSAVFTVTTPPKLGRLVERIADNSSRPVSSFTQGMVGDNDIINTEPAIQSAARRNQTRPETRAHHSSVWWFLV